MHISCCKSRISKKHFREAAPFMKPLFTSLSHFILHSDKNPRKQKHLAERLFYSIFLLGGNGSWNSGSWNSQIQISSGFSIFQQSPFHLTFNKVEWRLLQNGTTDFSNLIKQWVKSVLPQNCWLWPISEVVIFKLKCFMGKNCSTVSLTINWRTFDENVDHSCGDFARVWPTKGSTTAAKVDVLTYGPQQPF